MKVKIRNPVARSPLLRKGGVHRVSKTGARHRQRLDLADELEESGEGVATRYRSSQRKEILADRIGPILADPDDAATF